MVSVTYFRPSASQPSYIALNEASTMKFLAFALSTLTLSSNHCNGFTHSATKTSITRAVDGAYSATSLKSINFNEQDDSAKKMSVNIAATTTLALGLWAAAASPSLASSFIDPTTASSSSSSSFVVSAEYSSSDFTDFSMPSYQDALQAELNSNLKGDKQLFKGEVASAPSSTR